MDPFSTDLAKYHANDWIDNCVGMLFAGFPAISAYACYRAKSEALRLMRKNPVEDGNEYYLG